MRLNNLRDNDGARKKAVRVGRGIGSTKGKTAGRGYKGHKARSGCSINGFEGGQMPLYRRLPKRGFNNIFRKNYAEVNVFELQKAIDANKLDASQPITSEALVAAGVVRRELDGIKLLGKGELSAKIAITVAKATKGAVALVEKAGGSVTVTAATAEAK